MSASLDTHPGRAGSIKTILIGISLTIGAVMLLAFVGGLGGLTTVYGIVGVVLIAQAIYYWWM